VLATVARFEARFGDQGEEDAALTALLEGVSAEIARECGRVWAGRPCLEEARRVLTFSVAYPDETTLRLPARPIVAVHAVREAFYGDFADADDLVEGDDYWADPEAGDLHRVGCWPQGRATVRVDVTAGYLGPDAFDADGWMPDAWASGSAYSEEDEVLFAGAVYAAAADIASSTSPPPIDADNWTRSHVLAPDDLVEACLVQAGHDWERRHDLSRAGTAVSGASVSWQTRIELLPEVKAICAGYRRPI